MIQFLMKLSSQSRSNSILRIAINISVFWKISWQWWIDMLFCRRSDQIAKLECDL